MAILALVLTVLTPELTVLALLTTVLARELIDPALILAVLKVLAPIVLVLITVLIRAHHSI